MSESDIPIPRKTPKAQLRPGVDVLFGVILPHCGFALAAFLLSGSFGPGEAGLFAGRGFLVFAGVTGAASFVVNLCLIASIPFVETSSAFLIGCIIPCISLLILSIFFYAQ